MAQLTSLLQLLPNQRIVNIPYTGGSQTFTVPFGFDTSIDVYLWGGGGGGGGTDSHGGGAGAGGQFMYGQVGVAPGDQVTIAVGSGGFAGGSGSGYGAGPGGQGAEVFDGKTFVGANGGNPGPYGWSGGGGGGGGATVVAVNGVAQAVAGGGGGGGGGGNYSYGANAPGSTNPAVAAVYPAPLWGTYPDFLSANGIWGPDRYSSTFDGSWPVTFPVTGVYKLYGTADNAFNYYINNVSVLQGSNWGQIYTGTYTIAAGTYTVAMHGDNWGGPASAAFQIVAPDGSTIFDSISPPANNQAYVPAQFGQSHGGDGGGGGGGGGGWPGGNGGGAGGGDVGANWGYSGTSYNALDAQNASGQTPGNPQSPFYIPGIAIGGSAGCNGSNGFATIVVTFKGLANIKHDGVWKPLVGSYFKVNGDWKFITGTWVKKHGVWVPAAGSVLNVGAPMTNIYGSDQSPNRGYSSSSPGGGDGGGWMGDGGQDSGDGDGGDGDGGE